MATEIIAINEQKCGNANNHNTDAKQMVKQTWQKWLENRWKTGIVKCVKSQKWIMRLKNLCSRLLGILSTSFTDPDKFTRFRSLVCLE